MGVLVCRAWLPLELCLRGLTAVKRVICVNIASPVVSRFAEEFNYHGMPMHPSLSQFSSLSILSVHSPPLLCSLHLSCIELSPFILIIMTCLCTSYTLFLTLSHFSSFSIFLVHSPPLLHSLHLCLALSISIELSPFISSIMACLCTSLTHFSSISLTFLHSPSFLCTLHLFFALFISFLPTPPLLSSLHLFQVLYHLSRDALCTSLKISHF